MPPAWTGGTSGTSDADSSLFCPRATSSRLRHGGSSGLSRAASDLAGELHYAREAAERARSRRDCREDELVREEAEAAKLREQALAMRALVSRRRSDLAAMEKKLEETASTFEAEKARESAEVATQNAQAAECLARARAESADAGERIDEALERRRRACLEEQESLQASAAASTPIRPPALAAVQASRARAAAETAAAAADAARFVSAALGPDAENTLGRWPRLVAEVAHAAAEALAAPAPACVRPPPALWALSAAAKALAEGLLELATTAQGCATSNVRFSKLEDALAEGRAREARLSAEVEAARGEELKLLTELVEARRCRREAEKEQAEFVPFAAEELEARWSAWLASVRPPQRCAAWPPRRGTACGDSARR